VKMLKMARHAVETPSGYISQPPLSGADRTSGTDHQIE
jgi:hypothetical protein